MLARLCIFATGNKKTGNMCGKVVFPYSTAVSEEPFLSLPFSFTNPPETFVCAEPLLMAGGGALHSINPNYNSIYKWNH